MQNTKPKSIVTQEHINSAIIGLWHQSHDIDLIIEIMEQCEEFYILLWDKKGVERIINDRLKNIK